MPAPYFATSHPPQPACTAGLSDSVGFRQVPLTADQQAMLQLLLERGQSYADLASVLGVDEAEVRSRARAALTELGRRRPGPTTSASPTTCWARPTRSAGPTRCAT